MQVMDPDCFKTDHRAVLAVLSLRSRRRRSAKLGVNLRGWKPNDTWQKAATETLTEWKNRDVIALLLVETSDAHTIAETTVMTGTELDHLLFTRKWRLQNFVPC